MNDERRSTIRIIKRSGHRLFHGYCIFSPDFVRDRWGTNRTYSFFFFLEANVVPDDSTINSRYRGSPTFPDLTRWAAVASTQSKRRQPSSEWTENLLPREPSARHRSSNRRCPTSPAIYRNHHWIPVARRNVTFHVQKVCLWESIRSTRGDCLCEMELENEIACVRKFYQNKYRLSPMHPFELESSRSSLFSKARINKLTWSGTW